MKPERLVLQNIGPFRGLHAVDFSALGDIFLVYGKTGAGKTTIFDAISFAFYGKVPGSRNGIERQMRSQFADENDPTAVELTFTSARRRYRVRRTLAYEKIGVRSKKPVPVQEESSLDEWSAGTWESRTSTNKSDTDRKILDIIKLSAEEFSRIVLLPQGEFARFLKLNSNERKDVLAKLFPIGQYTRVTELARTRAKEARLRVDETERAIDLLRTQFNDLSWKDDRDALAREIILLRERQGKLRNAIGETSALLEKARAADGRKAQEKELAAQLAALEERSPANAARKQELEDARRAVPLMVELSAIGAARERRAALSAELGSIGRELDETGKELAVLESRDAAIRDAAKEKDGLLVRKERLQTAVKIAESLEALEVEYAATKSGLAEEKKRLAGIETGNAGRQARIAALEPDMNALEERTKRQGLARDELEKRKTVYALAQEYDRERKSRDAHRETVRRAEADMARNRSDISIAKAELEALEAEEKAGRENNLASGLAARLEEGKPCPVCGSTSHPAPAIKREIDGFALADRINAGKRRCETLETEYARLAQERAARGANLETAEERLARLNANVAFSANVSAAENEASGIAVPSPDEASRSLEEAVRLAQETYDLLSLSRAALRETGEIRAKIARDESELARSRTRISALETDAAGQKAGIAHAKARYLEAFPESRAGGIAGSAGGASAVNSASAANNASAVNSARDAGDRVEIADASDELERCTARILEIEARISAHETKLADARMKKSSLGGKKEGQEKTLSALETEIASLSEAFAAGCAKAAFPDGDAVRKAARTAEEQREIEAGINAFIRELADTKTLLDRVKSEIAGWSGPSSETLEADIAGHDRALEETGRNLEDRTAALSNLDNLKKRWDGLEAERAARSIEGSRLKALADDLTGVNPAKTSFDAWILGMYLEEITAYANSRLERMSEGRYRIMLDENYRKGNSLAGLELEILDAHTGKSRPTGTLSGGETFMASISLALGLADSIQSRAGGIQLDAVFIDEGFGSLDESSLERAITILDEIRGSRMVGLISHVGELRNRIPNRIEIIKTGAGSEIRADTGEPVE